MRHAILATLFVASMPFAVAQNNSTIVAGTASRAAPAPRPQPAPRVGVSTKPAAVQVTGNGPKINCPEPTFDFGEAPQSDKVEHDFVIENTGGADLHLTGVTPACQCTAALPEKSVLKPGERTVIHASLNTLTFNGPITKTIDVVSNDTSNPHLRLTITGKVQAPFHVSVTEISFGNLRKTGDAQHRSFEVLVGAKGTGIVKDVRSDNPIIHVSMEALPAASVSRGWKVNVDLDAKRPVGPLRATITITTDVVQQMTIAIPVVAQVDGDVSVTPKTFNFGKVKKGDTATTRVVVVEKSGTPDLKIEGVDVKPAGSFVATVKEVTPGAKYEITLTLGSDNHDGYTRGELGIRTNCAGENLLSAYFYAFIGN